MSLKFKLHIFLI